MSKDVREEVERLRAALREQLRRASKVVEELRRLEEAIEAALKHVEIPKTSVKSKRHR